MNDDIVRFFVRSGHYRPEVIRRIVIDIDTLCNSLCFLRKITKWGTLEQPKICIYGGLPVKFSVIPKGEGGESIKEKEPQLQTFMLPIQIWLSHQFPIEPPFIYLVCSSASENPKIPEGVDTSVIKIVSNHPNVDFTGLCFCRELAEWNPSSSSLCYTIERFSRALERSSRCPICIDEGTSGSSPAIDGNESDTDRKSATDDIIANSCLVCYGKKDTVLIPCGHYCLCVSCAVNITECPLCRAKIMLRQRIFD
ncbi:unspecified product [Leptomonas pyrrhocoris]|uniref:Unspecified product n=1 Tax=Leptomonas pyrrhocoris TaxID=157538 RepID=A0A0M9FWV1_LEPPY|nr:unspecified product [Leptomonas pyrrhocoris]XP_015656062.1 unspecified product [Leptomonas pyrrhocoris]KPA77622.1 unspecified product [Leptomonas pyrrhocoris]KPA77623.1 unspecified product [Leptomonas pyrrhocoris]|eukprot:XP_015656061.1 unspecified product [Leptomonas pyrrhocoris]